MNLILLAMPFLLTQSFQDSDTGELRFTRVHLRNGNFIDGQIVNDGAGSVLLRIRAGEIDIRRDQIDRVEIIKLRDLKAMPTILKRSDAEKADSDPNRPPAKAPEILAPEALKKKVDMMLFKFKSTPGAEKEFPYQDLAALGEDAVVYFASRVPAFDIETQDAMAVALINLTQLKASAKVNSVLEGFLTLENPTVRAFAVGVLGVGATEAEKLRYFRPMLKDADLRVRSTVLAALSSVEDRSWFEPVGELSADADANIRNRALQIMKNLSTKLHLEPQFVHVMVDHLTHAVPDVRVESAKMLGFLGQPESWKDLASALNDPEPTVRAAVAQSLMTMAIADSGPEIVSAISHERDFSTRIYLAGAVQRMKLLKAINGIISWLGEPEEDVRKLASGTLAALTGQSFGQDREKWEAWYAANKPN